MLATTVYFCGPLVPKSAGPSTAEQETTVTKKEETTTTRKTSSEFRSNQGLAALRRKQREAEEDDDSSDISHNVTSTKVVSSRSTAQKSFLRDHTPITGVQDVVSRMGAEADGEKGSEAEARSLLNKFLGAQVLVNAIDPLMGEKGITTSRKQSSTTTKSLTVAEGTVVHGVDVSLVTDADQLKELLNQTEDTTERSTIRERLRELSATKSKGAQGRTDGGSKSPRKGSTSSSTTTAPDSNRQPFQSTQGGAKKTDAVDNKVVTEKTIVSPDGHTRTQKITSETVKTEPSPGTTVMKTSRTIETRTSFSTKDGGSKAPVSAFDKFKQMDAASAGSNRSGSGATKTGAGPAFKLDPGLSRSASSIKDMLLQWCQAKTKSYENVRIENFSGSWSNGMAFCALIHRHFPDAFDFKELSPENRRYNFELAFRVAEEKGGIAPLLEVDDMVRMARPDWKCVFTYVQSIYSALRKLQMT